MSLWDEQGGLMLARDYKIRVFIVFACFVILFAVIIIRLFLLQVHQKDFFNILAKQQHELTITLNPRRAIIYDRTGTFPLAFNREVPSAFLVPQQLIEPQKTLRFLKKYYPEVHQRVVNNPDKQFVWLDRKLTSEKAQWLVNQKLQDVHVIGEFKRFYPLVATSQLLGFTDIDNIGTAGIELNFSKQLGGLPKKVRCERDARSGLFYFEKAIQRHGKKSKPLTLTVDSTLQSLAYHELKTTVHNLNAKLGSVIIINPDNGEIEVMTNYPSFDPNQKGVPSLEMMKNNGVNECYEFGSVMKAFCALAALEEDVVQLDEPIDCEGRYGYIDGVKIENPTIALLNKLAQNNNMLPFRDVIRYSSNVGIAKVAKRLGPRLYMHLRRLGFGSRTEVEFPGERDGFVNPPERWSKPSLIVMSFGYELMATLMQLAKAFCIIANGGYEVTPTLIKHDHVVSKGKRLYKEQTINQLKDVLQKVCEKHQIPGFLVLGKTGTARCVRDGRYTNQAHNYTFAGMIEKGDYRRVFVTFVKEPEKTGLWASEVALPLFKTVAQRTAVHSMVHHRLA